MLVAFLVVFIDLLGFGIVLPLLPLIGEGYLRGETPAVKGITLGVLFSVFSLMQFLFSPVWGRVSDRYGRRPVLLVSLGGSVVFYALFAAACVLPTSPDWKWWAIALMMVSRVGAGIAGASVSTASAVIADSTTPETRSKGMALIGVAFGIGFTFGPLIGFAVLSLFPDAAPAAGDAPHPAVGLDHRYAWVPGATAAVLSLVALLVAVARFKETLRPHAHPLPGRALFSVARTVEVLRMPAVGPLVLTYFLAIFAFANFEATLSLFTEDKFGFTVKQNFLVFAGVGCVLMIAQGGFYRRFAGRVSDPALLRAGLLMMVLGLGGIGVVAYQATELGKVARQTAVVPDTADATAADAVREAAAVAVVRKFQWVLYAAMAVAVSGFAFVNPSVAALVSKRADPARQGEVQGVNQSFAAFGRILGPLAGLMTFQAHESRVVPFAVAVGVLAVVAGVQPFIGKAAPQPATAPPPDVAPPVA
jgi:MFS family permease